MTNKEGYIRLHRGLLEWQHYQEPSVLQVFITLLLIANWKDGWFKGKRVRKGECITTTATLSLLTNLSAPTVDKCLKILRESGEIEYERKNMSGTHIKVVNYHKFNSVDSKINLESTLQSNLESTLESSLEDRINKERKNNNVVVDNNSEAKVFFKQKKIKSEDLYDWLKFESGQIWQENAMMQLGIHDRDELLELFRRYQQEVISQGIEEENERDIKSHFMNQTRIYLRERRKENGYGNCKKGGIEHTDPRQLERIARQMAEYEQRQRMEN